jgi:hypothetical protein
MDKKTNRVYVVFYDRRNSEFNRYTDVYVACLKDAKVEWNRRVSETSFCAPGPGVFFGDYISVAAARDQVRMAFTTYDQEKLFATVMVAITTGKELRSKNIPSVDPTVQFIELKDSGQLYIHFAVPDAKSCTLELSRAGQLFYKQLFNPLTTPENEVLLPLDKFPAGVYNLELSFRGRKINKDVYIDRH